MTIPTQYDLDKALVSQAIESVLSNHQSKCYDKIVEKLNKNNFFIPDCFDNPKYFNQILREEFGTSFIEIIYSIHTWLGDSSSNELISKFLIDTLQETSRSMTDEQDMTITLIVLAIENALLNMGVPELNLVESKLQSDFNYTLNDCVKNPTPLKKVLCELFGNCYEDIYKSVTNSLIATSMNESTTKFLIVMKA